MKSKILIIIILIFSFSFSQEEGKKKKDKVKFDGKAEIGIDFKAIGGLNDKIVNDSRLNRIGVVETELKILPADNVELEFDLEFDYRFTDVNLKKLFVRYNFDNSNIRLGFMKKMFGLEEIKGSGDNLFVKKSMINDILEDFFLLEHDFTTQYRYNFPSLTLIGGYSVDGSNRHFANLTLMTNKIYKSKFTLAGMYVNYKEKGFPDDSKRQNAFFGNLAMEFDGKITDFELETFVGKNPEIQGFNYFHADFTVNPASIKSGLFYDEQKGFGFFGLRFQESFPINIGRKHLNRIIPVYEISYTYISEYYWQARPGLNFTFTPKERLQWRTNVDLNFQLSRNSSDYLRNDLISQRVVTAIFVTW